MTSRRMQTDKLSPRLARVSQARPIAIDRRTTFDNADKAEAVVAVMQSEDLHRK